MKDREMCGISCFITENTTRHNHVDRGCHILHDAYLYWRRVRTQDRAPRLTVIDIESVVHTARWMRGRHI